MASLKPSSYLSREAFFNPILRYKTLKKPSNTTQQIAPIFTAQEILDIQQLIRRIPVADNVVEYAVKLVAKTRPDSDFAPEDVKKYLSWGAGPRASQFLVLAAKSHAAINGKYSPDIEDVKAISYPVLRHRIVRNYKAEAEGMSVEKLIHSLL